MILHYVVDHAIPLKTSEIWRVALLHTLRLPLGATHLLRKVLQGHPASGILGVSAPPVELWSEERLLGKR